VEFQILPIGLVQIITGVMWRVVFLPPGESSGRKAACWLQFTLIDEAVEATPPAVFLGDWRSIGGLLFGATPPADSGERQRSKGGLLVFVGDPGR
jgi:hypothetical protein